MAWRRLPLLLLLAIPRLEEGTGTAQRDPIRPRAACHIRNVLAAQFYRAAADSVRLGSSRRRRIGAAELSPHVRAARAAVRILSGHRASIWDSGPQTNGIGS